MPENPLSDNKFALQPGQKPCPECKGSGIKVDDTVYQEVVEGDPNACPVCEGRRWVPDDGGEPAQPTELELFDEELRSMSPEALIGVYDQLSTNLVKFEATDVRYPRMKARWQVARTNVLLRMRDKA